MLTVAELMARTLAANRMNTVFCLPGYQLDPFMDAMYDLRETVRVVHTRHEQGAAYMALGAFAATNKPQLYCVVAGPGFLNTTAALSTALAVNARILAMIGEIPLAGRGKGLGLLHEIPNAAGILASLTKHAESLESGSKAKQVLTDTWRSLSTGPPGPVGLSVPTDIWKEKTAELDASVFSRTPSHAINEEKVERAASMILCSKSPLIVVGGGAQDCSEDVKRLSEAIKAPVVAFRSGQGVLPAESENAISMPVAHELWPQVDLVVGLGTRLRQLSMWGHDRKLKSVHITLNADELGRVDIPTVGICGDLVQALPLILSALEGKESPNSDWADTVQSVKDRINRKVHERLKAQLDWLRAIRSELPPDGILVDEITQMGYVSRLAYPVHKPRTFITSGYQGTLGYGYATALGAAISRPDVPVVNFCGDGGALYALNEISTAVHHKINLTTVIFVDGHFGNVRTYQRNYYQGRFIATELSNPDFVKYAESFGAQGLRAQTPQELRLRLREGMAHAGPTLIEIPVDEFNSPWEFILLPKNRGPDAGKLALV